MVCSEFPEGFWGSGASELWERIVRLSLKCAGPSSPPLLPQHPGHVTMETLLAINLVIYCHAYPTPHPNLRLREDGQFISLIFVFRVKYSA